MAVKVLVMEPIQAGVRSSNGMRCAWFAHPVAFSEDGRPFAHHEHSAGEVLFFPVAAATGRCVGCVANQYRFAGGCVEEKESSRTSVEKPCFISLV